LICFRVEPGIASASDRSGIRRSVDRLHPYHLRTLASASRPLLPPCSSALESDGRYRARVLRETRERRFVLSAARSARAGSGFAFTATRRGCDTKAGKMEGDGAQREEPRRETGCTIVHLRPHVVDGRKVSPATAFRQSMIRSLSRCSFRASCSPLDRVTRWLLLFVDHRTIRTCSPIDAVD